VAEDALTEAQSAEGPDIEASPSVSGPPVQASFLNQNHPNFQKDDHAAATLALHRHCSLHGYQLLATPDQSLPWQSCKLMLHESFRLLALVLRIAMRNQPSPMEKTNTAAADRENTSWSAA
jgi:hypothetical protein